MIYWFDQIIHDHIISIPRKGVINVHAAFLPQCRGLFPVLYSATKNDGIYGITAHEIEDAQIDAGPILAQRLVEVPSDRSIIYRDAIVNCGGVGTLSEVLDDFDSFHQKRRYTDGGSYFSYPTRADMREARRAGIRLATFRISSPRAVSGNLCVRAANLRPIVAVSRGQCLRTGSPRASPRAGKDANGNRKAGVHGPQGLSRA